MSEGGASGAVKEAKADYGWAMMVLGALLSASSVISLIQHGFHFHLNWGFEHFVAFYRGIITPVMDVLSWPLRAALLSWLQIDWRIPQWLSDVWSISFVVAAIQVRVILFVLPRWTPLAARNKLIRSLQGVWLTVIFGYTFFSVLVLMMLMYFSWVLLEQFLWERKNLPKPVWIPSDIQRSILDLLRAMGGVACATALAVIAFYVSNAIAPQLGLG